jgi:hypothetical protein
MSVKKICLRMDDEEYTALRTELIASDVSVQAFFTAVVRQLLHHELGDTIRRARVIQQEVREAAHA